MRVRVTKRGTGNTVRWTPVGSEEGLLRLYKSWDSHEVQLQKEYDVVDRRTLESGQVNHDLGNTRVRLTSSPRRLRHNARRKLEDRIAMRKEQEFNWCRDIPQLVPLAPPFYRQSGDYNFCRKPTKVTLHQSA